MLDPTTSSALLPGPLDVAARAAAQISGCEACSAEVQLPFDCLIADAMNRSGMFEFVLQASRCPLCHVPATEKTLGG